MTQVVVLKFMFEMAIMMAELVNFTTAVVMYELKIVQRANTSRELIV